MIFIVMNLLKKNGKQKPPFRADRSCFFFFIFKIGSFFPPKPEIARSTTPSPETIAINMCTRRRQYARIKLRRYYGRREKRITLDLLLPFACQTTAEMRKGKAWPRAPQRGTSELSGSSASRDFAYTYNICLTRIISLITIDPINPVDVSM